MITKISDLIKPDLVFIKKELKKNILNLKLSGFECLDNILGAGRYLERLEVKKEQIIDLIIDALILLRNTLDFRAGAVEESNNLQEDKVNKLIEKYTKIKESAIEKIFANLNDMHKQYVNELFDSVELHSYFTNLKNEVKKLEETRQKLGIPWRT
ncbi:hypothetical protein RRG48_04885 [Mycoplasmopsis canis]|uniref:hypothetical protein n=1 Tax=Mycoplasmopsis cynos TaxID=171284 RepID=UPI002968467E|nr:hypothetical protein [Mycoplasmopsis cynos]MCU9933435.1 hypothetical protein [Mycoplasmopsis cynos]WQQ13440.1 hypothetical protein RRG58_01695 [Mycoplasmopsis cynos]WQQ13715.1 hypothetical protein RRG52_03105 [Mycoplasmopsis cynos]